MSPELARVYKEKIDALRGEVSSLCQREGVAQGVADDLREALYQLSRAWVLAGFYADASPAEVKEYEATASTSPFLP